MYGYALRALWRIACECLHSVNTNFFDDYIVTSEEESLRVSTSQAFESLLGLLCWTFDREGPKVTVFSKPIDALGLTLDLSDSSRFILRILNTESRKEEIVSDIATILSEGKLGKAKALQLRAHVGFAENQVFGRSSKQAMRVLVERAFFAGGDLLTKELRLALKALKDMIEFGADREISSLSCLTFMILTDAL